jgi:peroxiredoxin
MRPLFLAALLALATQATAQGKASGQPPAPPSAQEPAQKPAKPVVLSVGTEVPADLTLKDTDGKAFSFSAQKGKIVLVHFWSTTCPWEVTAEPKLNKLTSDFKDKDVVVVAINSNAGEVGKEPEPSAFEAKDGHEKPYGKLRKKATASGMDHKILVDHTGDVARLFGAKSTPHCFVFDAKGVLAYSGALDGDGKAAQVDDAKQYVRSAIDALRAGQPVAQPTTKPYG